MHVLQEYHESNVLQLHGLSSASDSGYRALDRACHCILHTVQQQLGSAVSPRGFSKDVTLYVDGTVFVISTVPAYFSSSKLDHSGICL